MRSYRFAAVAALTLALLLTATSTTNAADLGGKPRAAAPVDDAPVSDILSYRGGLSVGVLGGYSAAVFEAEEIDFGAQDPFVGGFVGYSHAGKGWLLGVEADYMLTSISTENGEGEFSFKADSDYLASIRGKAGVTLGPIAFYGTGGVAFMEQTITINGVSDTQDLMGFTVGAGVEAELTRTITIRLEALNYQFEAENFVVNGEEIKGDVDQTVVRAGVGFKLN